MTTDLRTEPEALFLANLNVGNLFLEVSRRAQLACGIDGELTEGIVTWALDLDPLMACAFPPQDRRLYLVEDLRLMANCGQTANRMFKRLTSDARATGVFANLGAHVATAARMRRRLAFHVRCLNHEFVIVVRNGTVEILQSFQGGYSLGWYLLERNTVYSPALLECCLNHVVLPDVQVQLFRCPLIGEAHEHRAEYNYAILKTDKEIWRALYADAVRGVDCYRSLLEVTKPATTCLFSGKATGEGTTEEHTLLRALGGRFRSRTAAASSFNNATSNMLDAPLAAPYALIMNALAPLLSSEHQPGSLDLIGEPGRRLVLDPGAVTRQRGVHVEARDPTTGRPIAMSAEDPLALAAMARSVGIPDERLEKTTIPPVPSQYAERRQSILSPWAETAVLKCALLTFDHLLGSHPNAFTRSLGLKGIRDAILAIVNGADPQLLISLTSWGIDNTLRAALLELADKYRPRPKSMFENVLLVSAQHGGNIDMHCLLAGVDVYRFRICTRWDGAPFNILCGAGMLVGEVPYGPIYVADAMPLGVPTDLRSVFPEGTSQEVVEDVGRRINVERQRAFVEAVLLVETMADDFAVKGVCGLEAFGASTVEQALRRRLEHLYADSVSAGCQALFTAIVDEAISSLADDVKRAPVITTSPAEWLGGYRTALKRLRSEVGLPVLLTEIATRARLAKDE